MVTAFIFAAIFFLFSPTARHYIIITLLTLVVSMHIYKSGYIATIRASIKAKLHHSKI
jgi:hypothetical protein